MDGNGRRVTVGIVGLGNMGGAIARGLLDAGVPAEDVLGFDVDPARSARFGGVGVAAVDELVARSEVVVAAVKPYHLAGAFRGIWNRAGGVLVSVAAGTGIADLRAMVGDGPRAVVRAMPNTAAGIRRSTTALVAEARCSEDDRALAEWLFGLVGETCWLADERLMHVATAVVGSAPAFVYVLAEALADAAVLEGLSRDDARRLTASMIRGAGDLLVAHDGSPAELKDRVASPSGTTIRGLRALEDLGFRAAAMEAVARTTARSKELS